jgi:hypothetical protein
MRSLIYLFILILFGSQLLASTYHTSSIDYNFNANNQNSSQTSCFYNGQVFLLTSLGNINNGVYHFKVNSGNTVSSSSLEHEEFPDGDYLGNINSSAMCVFNGALYLFSPFEGGNCYLSYYYRTDRWYGKDYNYPFMLEKDKEPKRVAAASIKDTLGLFFVDFFGKLYYRHMNTRGEWSSAKEIAHDLICQNPSYGWDDFSDYGNISCTTYHLNDQLLYILSVTSRDHRHIEMWHITTDGTIIDKASYKSTTDVYNVTIIDGSVEGAGTGRPVQVMYSYHGSLYSCEVKASRMDYYPEKKEFKEHENFGICPSVDSKDFNLALAAYVDESDKNDLRKKIVMSYLDYSNKYIFNEYKPTLRFVVWNSDRLHLLHEIQDTTIPSFRRLIGLVEGPPPLTLNGYTYGDATNDGFEDISEIELGHTYANSSSTTNGFQHTVKFKNEVFGISEAFSSVVSKETTYTSDFEYSEGHSLHPLNGQLLMKVEMVPHLNKKFYGILDQAGNVIDTISTITCTGTSMEYNTDFLSKSDPNLNLEDVSTYMNRNIDFDAYDHLYKSIFQFSAGSKNSFQLSMEKEYTKSSSHSMSITPSVGGNNDSLGFFRLATKTEYKTSIEMTTTTKMASELNLTLHCPGGDEPGEIIAYKGVFHWLDYTEGENNWWVITGLKGDKPWCMTYEVYSYEEYKE